MLYNANSVFPYNYKKWLRSSNMYLFYADQIMIVINSPSDVHCQNLSFVSPLVAKPLSMF